MIESLIYVDNFLPEIEGKVKSELGLSLVKRMNEKDWSVRDALQIITDPKVVLAVINNIDEIALMEASLLNFMCKPILVTHRAIINYPMLERTIDFVDFPSNMNSIDCRFISWFKWWETQ